MVGWNDFPMYALMAYNADITDSALKDLIKNEDPYSRADAQDAILKEFANKFSPTRESTSAAYDWGTQQIADAFQRLDRGASYQGIVNTLNNAAANADDEGITRNAARMIGSALLSAQRHEAETRRQNADPMRYQHVAVQLAAQGKDPSFLLRGIEMMNQQQAEETRRKALMDRISKMRFKFAANGPEVSGMQAYRNWLRAKQGQAKYKSWLDRVS